MAKKSTAPAPIADEAGQAWQGKADEAWAQATGRAEQLDDPDQPAILFYDAPPLPDFSKGASKHVKREVLGRYLSDGSVVHDVHNAQPGCKADSINPATFYHFGHEVPDDLTRHTCVDEAADHG